MRKCKNFIEGKNIYLRELKISDVNRNYRNWMNDPEVMRYMESRFEKWSIKKLKDYVSKIRNNSNYLFLAIILKDGNTHIGNIKVGPIHRVHKFADVGIVIGERIYWGKGIATEAIKLIADYAFNKLNLHKLTAGAYEDNIGSIKVFRKAGFSVEGIKEKHYLYNGNYVDAVLLKILRK